MTTLRYQSRALVDDLGVGECTVHRASGSSASRWWLLWFHVLRDTDQQPEIFCVPVRIGSYEPYGSGGRTWGLTPVRAGVWQVSPSINVLDDRDAVNETHQNPSLWHQTPTIEGVPDDEPWVNGVDP